MCTHKIDLKSLNFEINYSILNFLRFFYHDLVLYKCLHYDYFSLLFGCVVIGHVMPVTSYHADFEGVTHVAVFGTEDTEELLMVAAVFSSLHHPLQEPVVKVIIYHGES